MVDGCAEIAAFADLGWRCIVPSQLGYHGTDKPVDPAEYTFKVGSRSVPVRCRSWRCIPRC